MTQAVSRLKAIGFAITAFTLWVMADSAIKLAGRSNLPNYEVVAFLGLFIALSLFVFAAWRGQVRQLWPLRPGRQVVRGLLELGNNLGVVIALRHLPLTLFYILVFLSPMVIVLLERIFLKEQLGWRKALAILTGFMGVLVAVNPLAVRRTGDWIGYAACAMCVSCFSTAMVWTRVISRTERPESMTFFSGLVVAAGGLLGTGLHEAPLHPRLLIVLLVMGVLCALANVCFFIAVKHTTAATVSQYHYTQLITGAVVAYLLFGETPTKSMMLGAVLITLSGLYIALNVTEGSRAAQQV